MMQRLVILLLVCGGLGFFAQREQARGSFDRLERAWLSQIRRVEGVAETAPPVVLVELRQGDLPFESWPPAPLDYALVFESLVRRQPKQVVVQPLLAWPGVEPLDAATLAERIALLPRGVLACTLQRGLEGGASGEAGVLPLPILREASGDLSRVPDFESLGQMPIEELRGGKPLGFTRIEFGTSTLLAGAEVALPMVARRGRELVPSLTTQALLTWHGAEPGEVVVQLGNRVALSGRVEVPVDATGRLAVSSRLAPPLRRLDAGALLLDLDRDAALMRERPAELETLFALNGALVVLGETGETTPRFAVAGAPEGGWTEAEVMARALVASLGGFHLREVPERMQWAIWAAVAAAAAGMLACPRRWVLVFGLGGAMMVALGTALAFLNAQWWMPPVPPLAIWAGGALVAFVLAPARPTAAPTASAPAVPAEQVVEAPAAGESSADEAAGDEAAAGAMPAVSNVEEGALAATATAVESGGVEGEEPPEGAHPSAADDRGEEGALDSLSRELAADETPGPPAEAPAGVSAEVSVEAPAADSERRAVLPPATGDDKKADESPAAGLVAVPSEPSDKRPQPPRAGKKGKGPRGKPGSSAGESQARE